VEGCYEHANAGKFVNSCTTGSFLRRAQLHEPGGNFFQASFGWLGIIKLKCKNSPCSQPLSDLGGGKAQCIVEE
jgi:hypothetical protein